MSEQIERNLRKNPIGPIRVSMPAKIAYDLDSFRSSLDEILEDLGCLKCFSGAVCTFELERQYVLGSAERINQFPALGRRDLGARDWVSPSRDVMVSVGNPERTFEIDSIYSIIDKVLGELGCLACCSGFDITFRTELENVVGPRVLNF